MKDALYVEIRKAVDNLLTRIKSQQLTSLEKTVIARIFISAALELLDETIEDVVDKLEFIRRMRGAQR